MVMMTQYMSARFFMWFPTRLWILCIKVRLHIIYHVQFDTKKNAMTGKVLQRVNGDESDTIKVEHDSLTKELLARPHDYQQSSCQGRSSTCYENITLVLTYKFSTRRDFQSNRSCRLPTFFSYFVFKGPKFVCAHKSYLCIVKLSISCHDSNM
jgi:hypothetical protein